MLAEEREVPYERPPPVQGVPPGRGQPRLDVRQDRQMVRRARRGPAPRRAGAEEIDLDELTVARRGDTIFDRLLIATGARPLGARPADRRRGRGRPTCAPWTTSAALQERLGPLHHLLVLGGGWMGWRRQPQRLTLGTTVDRGGTGRAAVPERARDQVARRFDQVRRAQESTSGWGPGSNTRGRGRGAQRRRRVHADTVLVGVGAIPNDELAREATPRGQRGPPRRRSFGEAGCRSRRA